VNWPAPRNVKEVQRFIVFANFYRRFIQGFSALPLPIQVLIHNGVMWSCSEQCEKAFVELKGEFTTGPILCHCYGVTTGQPKGTCTIQNDTRLCYTCLRNT